MIMGEAVKRFAAFMFAGHGLARSHD